jgi:hypothetical protein
LSSLKLGILENSEISMREVHCGAGPNLLIHYPKHAALAKKNKLPGGV